MSSESRTRRYRKQERARREEETHLRITKAAVELHRTKGPANTMLSEVAKLAGVSRMTIYNHFPTEVDLFAACSGHWAEENPFPDPQEWARIEDPSVRLVAALCELYEWYEDKQDMLGKVFRDLPIVAALQTVMAGLWSGYVEMMITVLSQDWPVEGEKQAELHATLALALDFNSWQVLTRFGLSHERAAKLVAQMMIALSR